jgi:hypothetical protein
MKKLLMVLALTLMAFLSPQAQAANWTPPGAYCNLYVAGDGFDYPWSSSRWSSWVVGTGSATWGANPLAQVAPNAGMIKAGLTATPGFALLQLAVEASTGAQIVESLCGTPWQAPNPQTSPALWCKAVANVKPILFGVTSGVISIVDTASYSTLTSAPFTLPKNGGWVEAETGFYATCPTSVQVRVEVNGRYDAMILDGTYIGFYY